MTIEITNEVKNNFNLRGIISKYYPIQEKITIVMLILALSPVLFAIIFNQYAHIMVFIMLCLALPSVVWNRALYYFAIRQDTGKKIPFISIHRYDKMYELKLEKLYDTIKRYHGTPSEEYLKNLITIFSRRAQTNSLFQLSFNPNLLIVVILPIWTPLWSKVVNSIDDYNNIFEGVKMASLFMIVFIIIYHLIKHIYLLHITSDKRLNNQIVEMIENIYSSSNFPKQKTALNNDQSKTNQPSAIRVV